ncbi:hypothetical protein VVD49_01235 [Uliginosibacterium sp. H3]|uniref:DUF1877 family protein n=1 Tax=Uliginosibacterium silvisoli TaxID=3114758 RepID=A0ABU6JYU1_9RHOO|nr:hypothetical protein [Uliginosibacterium sp. H3]
MSAIASFYLLPSVKSQQLVAAAQAQTAALTKKKWGIFKPKLPLNPDPFWSFLSSQARELAEFPYSGYLLLDVDLMIKEALAGDDTEKLASRLAKITGSSFVTYSSETAKSAIRLLEDADLSEPRIQTFLEGEGRGEEYPEFVGPLRDAVSCLKAWLQEVTGDTVGILNIG